MGSRVAAAKDLQKFTNDFKKEYFKNKYDLKPIKETTREDKVSVPSRPISGVPSQSNLKQEAKEEIPEQIDIDQIDERFEKYFKNLDTKQYDILKPSGSEGNLANPAEDPMRMTSNLDGLDLELSQNTRAFEGVNESRDLHLKDTEPNN